MHRTRPTRPVGLYDPTYEHDACGVALSRGSSGEPSHETVQRGDHRAREPRAPRRGGRRPEHRRRRRDPAPAARRAPARRHRRGAAAAGRLRRRGLLPARRTSERRAELEALLDRAPSRPRASASSAGATSRSTRTTSASPPTTSRPTSSSSSSPPRDELARRPGRVRAQALRDPPRGRARRRPGPRDPVASRSRTIVYKGMLTAPAAARLLPRPAGPAHQDRARARPLALLDQHVPELGARAPVPR